MTRDPVGDDRQPEAGKARRLDIGIERERGHLRLKSRDDMGNDGSSGQRGEAFVLPTHAARIAARKHDTGNDARFHRRTLSPARAPANCRLGDVQRPSGATASTASPIFAPSFAPSVSS